MRAEQAQQWEADRAREQDLQDIEAALNRPGLTADQRTAMESARGELQTVEAGDESRAAREREERLLARLRAEHEAVKKLEDAWKRMGGGRTP